MRSLVIIASALLFAACSKQDNTMDKKNYDELHYLDMEVVVNSNSPTMTKVTYGEEVILSEDKVIDFTAERGDQIDVRYSPSKPGNVKIEIYSGGELIASRSTDCKAEEYVFKATAK